ncbi:proteinase-activated receptor 3 isoform X2 [Ahaetulla prasina]|uniref:proteinase-activated receptor 3 isoform X2 n=1 Tax=Ahaetulla prasina TaxID=499056 RepID=UPI0026499695|nr:proteinase-activated receptor 3 isoform X2 [Ahaetulla prasina]
MKTWLLLTTGLFYLSFCLCRKGNKCGNSSLNFQYDKSLPIRTFYGTPQGMYEPIPISALDGLTKPNHKKEKCPTEISNISSLKNQISPYCHILHKFGYFGFPFLYYAAIQNCIPPEWQ